MLDPNFSDNETAYIYHTYEENGTLYNRVVRVRKEGDAWRETSVLLDRIPGGRTHNGGRMSIGPDGKLYVTTGDAGDSALAQDVDSLAGKILRLELNGKIPEDNPFADSYVYSYGHRNPQGLAWSADGKRMYSSEHGSSAYDELNVIEAEGNYGWPTVRGDEKREGMRGPLAHSGTNTWAPSGIAYHEGALYVTGLRGSMLFRFDLDRETTDVLLQGEGRLRDVYIEAPYVYVITNNTDGRGDPNKQDDRLLKLLLPE